MFIISSVYPLSGIKLIYFLASASDKNTGSTMSFN